MVIYRCWPIGLYKASYFPNSFFYLSQPLLAMPDAGFKPIPMSATDKLREYYQNSLGNLGLGQLCCISRTFSRTLGEPKNARNEKGIKASTICLTTELKSRNNTIDSLILTHATYHSLCLEKSLQISVESRKILRAITTVMKLEKEYTNGGMGKSSFPFLYNWS